MRSRPSWPIEFPGSEGQHRLHPSAASGKTDFTIKRNGREIVAVNAPVPKLNDPDSDRLDEELNKLPEKVATMKDFDVEKLPGFVASWSFDKVQDGTLSASGQTNVPGIPASQYVCRTGSGRQCCNVSSNGLVVPLDLKSEGKLNQEMTCSFWVKSSTKPWMGTRRQRERRFRIPPLAWSRQG